MKLSSATATVFDAPAAYAVANGASQTNLRVVEVSEPRTRDEWDSARSSSPGSSTGSPSAPARSSCGPPLRRS